MVPQPTFDIAIQGKYLSPDFLAGTGAGNHAIVLQGSQVGVPYTISPEAFLALTPEDVTAAFERSNPIADRQTTDTVVLDMEPTWGRPQFWYRQPLAFFHQLKMICDTIKSLLPNCRLSLYAFFPPAMGDLSAGNWIGQEFQGYLTAGRTGVYNSLSYLCVILRSPYVPVDRAYHLTQRWLATGLAAASTFRLPLLGLMGFDNVNGSSSGYQKPYPVSTLRMQMQAARDGGCLSCVLWGADQSRVNLGVVKSLADGV